MMQKSGEIFSILTNMCLQYQCKGHKVYIEKEKEFNYQTYVILNIGY